MKANDEGARPFTDAEKGETQKMLNLSAGCNSTILSLSTFPKFCTLAPAMLAMFTLCLQMQMFINVLTFYNPPPISCPWLSFCRFLGQHQQMFKLFEKVLPTFCVTFTIYILDIRTIYSLEIVKMTSFSPYHSAGWFTTVIILGVWWRILGELHHWRLTQVQILDQRHKHFIWQLIVSAATWETRRTLILGWSDSPQGFQRLMKRTLPRWG